MVRDKYGRKMSKSLGNVIDPLEVINGCELEELLAKIHDGNLPAKEVTRVIHTVIIMQHGYWQVVKISI
jgi:valyl-tRNA synthetase